jgi:predicted Zn-dependent protease with MMP-like domain
MDDQDRVPPHTENIGELSDRQFDELEDYSEDLAKSHGTDVTPDAFDHLVQNAIDRLPEEFRIHLEAVPVIVSDLGRQHGAYGLYQGDTVAYDNYPDRILIFRDTLLRDFGHNPELLTAQVERVVRHELAHHLGWDEPGVASLGL